MDCGFRVSGWVCGQLATPTFLRLRGINISFEAKARRDLDSARCFCAVQCIVHMQSRIIQVDHHRSSSWNRSTGKSASADVLQMLFLDAIMSLAMPGTPENLQDIGI